MSNLETIQEYQNQVLISFNGFSEMLDGLDGRESTPEILKLKTFLTTQLVLGQHLQMINISLFRIAESLENE
jgi:hypothetical protein